MPFSAEKPGSLEAAAYAGPVPNAGTPCRSRTEHPRDDTLSIKDHREQGLFPARLPL